ncbi:MAG TPA: hypothetical protein VFG87_13505 [Amycolatopsis sp.]|nr:hypothetical protein [Amycolatopsis sp.]
MLSISWHPIDFVLGRIPVPRQVFVAVVDADDRRPVYTVRKRHLILVESKTEGRVDINTRRVRIPPRTYLESISSLTEVRAFTPQIPIPRRGDKRTEPVVVHHFTQGLYVVYVSGLESKFENVSRVCTDIGKMPQDFVRIAFDDVIPVTWVDELVVDAAAQAELCAGEVYLGDSFADPARGSRPFPVVQSAINSDDVGNLGKIVSRVRCFLRQPLDRSVDL